MATKAPVKKAPAKKAAAAAAPLAHMAEKEPTSLHVAFLEWMEKQTGVTGLDLKSVQLATVLRGDFQKSEENQSRLRSRKDEIAKQEQEREARRAAREKAAADKAAKKAAPAPAAKKTASTAKAAPAAKKTAPKRRTPAAASASTESFE